jgi:hypothetical protein
MEKRKAPLIVRKYWRMAKKRSRKKERKSKELDEKVEGEE